MNILFDAINISLLISVFINLSFGFFVFFHGRKKASSLLFFLNLLAIVAWSVSMVVYRSVGDESKMFWAAILYISPTFIVSFFIAFSYYFPSKKEGIFFIPLLLTTLANIVMIAMLLWPELIIEEIIVRPGLEKKIIFSEYYFFYSFYIVGGFIFGFSKLLKKHRRASALEKKQITYLVFGYGLSAILAFITNLILPYFGYFDFNLGPIFTIILTASTAYAVVAYRIMDLKIAIRKNAVFLIQLALLFLLWLFLKLLFFKGQAIFSLFDNYVNFSFLPFINSYEIGNYGMIVFYLFIFKNFFTFLFSGIIQFYELIILFVLVSFFFFSKKYFYNYANKYFFSSFYDSRQIISQLNKEIGFTLNEKKIYEKVYQILKQAFHFQAFAVFVHDEESGFYKMEFNQGFVVKGKIRIKENLVNGEILQLAKLIGDGSNKKNQELAFELFELKAQILVPIKNKNKKTIALLALAQKESGDIYNKEDLELLEVVCSNLAVSLENIKLAKAIKKWSENSLKQKTETLTDLNSLTMEEARQLYKFAELGKLSTGLCHDLVNPLTALYLNLEQLKKNVGGKAGFNQALALTKKIERFIVATKKQISSEKIEKKFCLNNEIEEVIKILDYKAKSAKVLIFFRANRGVYVYGNPVRFSQVMLNIISNAIDAYNDMEKADRTVEIDLKGQEGQVIIKITDFARLIKEEHKDKIFQPFFTTKANSNGIGIGLANSKEIIEKDFGGKIILKQTKKSKTFFLIF